MASSGRLLVLGGTGPLGREIVARALERGDRVTAVARRPERLAVRDARLTVVAADVAADPGAIGRILAGHDAVVSALGRGRSLRSQGLMAGATPTLVEAMRRLEIRRLVYVSAFGVEGTSPQTSWLFRLMFRVMLADIYADKAAGEKAVRASGLDWTILAPVLLTNGAAKGRYRLEERPEIRSLARIPRSDVAAAVLRCVDDPATICRRLIVAP